MTDTPQTPEQLLAELTALRQQILGLENLEAQLNKRLEKLAESDKNFQFPSSISNPKPQTETEQAMAKLLQLSHTLVRTHDLESVLNLAVTAAVEIAPAADKGSLQLLEPETQTLHTVAVSGVDEKILSVTPFQPGVGIAGHALVSGQTINVPDVLEDERFVKGNLPLRFRALLVAPLVIKDAILGVISLSSVYPNAFSEAHESLIQLIADQTATAIENARLFTDLNRSQQELKQAHDTLEQRVIERTAELTEANKQLQAEIAERERAEAEIRKRNSELALLNQVIATTSTGLEVETILDTVCRELVIAFNVPQANATLFNDDRTEAIVIAEHLANGQPSSRNQSLSLAQNPAYHHLLNYKAPLFIIAGQDKPRVATLQSKPNVHEVISRLLLPVNINDEIAGSLELNIPPNRAFSTEEVNVAWSVADQVASVISRVRFEEDRRRLEAQYHQAQKMETVGRLAAGVAHDFNNLLAVINGFSALIKAEVEPNSRHYDFISMILDSGWSASDLVNQLLAFSRKQIIEPKILNLNTIILDTQKMLNRILGENVTLHTDLAPDLWPIKSDPVQMEQIVVNMAVNARDAMPNGGILTISSHNVSLTDAQTAKKLSLPPDDYISLTIKDTGQGIPKDVQEHVFEPFFTTKEAGKGTGLGLATVFGIVKQNGGAIHLKSEADKGTTFTIYFPRNEDGLIYPQKNKDATIPVGSETILVVEDDHTMRRLTRLMLQKQGYTLLEAPSGESALQLAANHSGTIHLLLTDVVMPGMSGKTLSEKLSQSIAGIKTLFMSGYTDDVIAQQGISAPYINLLQKPFSPEALARKVRDVLDQAE